MVKREIQTMAWVGLMLPVLGFGQQPCTNGIRIDGLVTDPTGAMIPGARVQTDSGLSTVNGYRLMTRLHRGMSGWRESGKSVSPE
jgi:hypothetical protein